MKSEKAEKLLYDLECGYPYSGYITMQDAEKVADLSEQEAEERMRAKAIEAFCMDCICASDGKHCSFGDDCAVKVDFIQKLNEE